MSDWNNRFPGEAFALHCPICDSVHIAETYVIETNGYMNYGVRSRARGSWRCCECGYMLPEMGLNQMYDILAERVAGTQEEKDYYTAYVKNKIFSALFSAMFKMWKKERDGEGDKDE